MNCRNFLLAVPAVLCLVAPSPAHAFGAIRVSVSPGVLLADGISTGTVTADVRSANGRPVRDGTEVRFYTTAGSITQAAFTSAGIARATLTSSAVPQAANVSVSAGVDQAVITVPMVSKLVEANVGGRVLRVDGKYVAYSEDKRFIQADEQVRVKFRGLTVEANSIQIDVSRNTLKALGRVNVASDNHTLVGERLWLDLKSFEGYMLAVGVRKWFNAYGLTELPEKPKNLTPDFDLVDLSDSKLVWVAKQANYIIDERVQVQGARAYVGGIKSVRMPFHESDLRVGFGEAESQYVGFGSEGVNVNLPLYLRMTPDSSTALHLGYGDRSGGVGYFTRDRGLSVDLVQKYGFAGASEGQAMITDLASPDRIGFSWNHTQKINDTTRLVTNLQFPEHRDMYGQMNLTSGLPIGTVHLAMGGVKPHDGNFAKTLSFGFETKPKALAENKLSVSGETSFYMRDAQQLHIAQGFRIPLQNDQYEAAGVKLRPASAKLPLGFTFDSSLSLREVIGNRENGFGPNVETQLRRQLPNGGTLGVGLNYNHLATVDDLLPNSGRLNSTLNVSYPVTKKLRLAAIGNMALDAQNRSSLVQAGYAFLPGWRLDLVHTMFKFGPLGESDYQLGLSRAFGSRDLSIYWSHHQHRFMFEFGASRF